MTIVRRNPLQAAIASLLFAGLLVTGFVATGPLTRAAVTGCGYGYDSGYGYGYGYGSCASSSNELNDKKLDVVEPGEDYPVHGNGFAGGSAVTITINSTPIVLKVVTTDNTGGFATTVTIP